MAWDITPEFKLETDPERASEIEVSFVAESDDRTRVTLEHRGLDRHGDGWERLSAMFRGPDAWQGSLESFAAVLAG